MSLISFKLEFLEELGVLDDGYSISRISPSESLANSIPDELLIVLQVLALPKEEFDHLCRRNRSPKPKLTLQSGILLKEAVQQRWKDYGTSDSQDTDILCTLNHENKIGHSSLRRYRMALQVRMGEKEILSEVQHSLDEYTAESNSAKRVSDTTTDVGEKRRKL